MENPEKMLERLAHSPSLKPFRDLVRPIERHDQQRRGDLLRTLRAFFHNNSNVSKTAERLYLHRNSMIYRLARIEELTGLDLRRNPDRLALQLGLLATEKGEEPGEAEHP